MQNNQNQTAQKTLKTVWDLPLRLFHWAMVLCVATAALTGYLFEDWWLNFHVWAGYALMSLLLFRIIWGFIGSPYSRFSNFNLSKEAVKDHLKGLLRAKSPEYSGHNPVGSWMIVFLLTTLFFLLLSGLFVWGGQENNGPLANVVGYGVGKASEEIHEFFAGLLMGLVAIHVSGVLVETFIFKHRVLPAMIDGKKPVSNSTKEEPRLWHSVAGVAIFALVVGAITYWVEAATPSKEFVVDPTYKQACAECHPAYHPSLRTATNWQAMMDGLENHYGEDASLDAQTAQTVLSYLQANSAEKFDTEASQRIGRVDTPSLRMTDTRFWQKKHDDFSDTVWKRSDVGSKVNCEACHKDAQTGRFDDDQIKLPKGVKT